MGMADKRRVTEQTPLLADSTTQTASAATVSSTITPSAASDSASRVATANYNNDRGDGTVNTATLDDGEGPATMKLVPVVSGLFLASFTCALDSTMMATLAEPIAGSFNGMQHFSWLTTSFFLGIIISQPLVGRLTDIFGRLPGFVLAVALFSAGNVVCAWSPSMEVFVAGRALAGLGTGGIAPIATFAISDLLPLRRRPLWIGIANTGYSIGSSLGGLIGGAVNDHVGWRWAFWVQVPAALLSILLVCMFLRIPNEPALKRDSTVSTKTLIKQIDFLGSALLSLFMVLLVFVADAGGTLLPWSDWRIIAGIVLCLLLFGLFLLVETRATLPIFPLSILKNQTVLACVVAIFFSVMARNAIVFYVPVFVLVQGASPTQAGLRFIPESLGIAISSLGTGYIMRATGRYYALNAVVTSLHVAAYAIAAFAFFTNTSAWLPPIAMFLVGFGYAGYLNTSFMASVSAVQQQEQAVVSSALYVSRNIGMVVSLAVSGVLLKNLLEARLHSNLDPYGHKASKLIPKLLDSLDELFRIVNKKWQAAAVLSYMEALKGVWLLLLGFAVVGAAASLLAREHRLHKRLDRSDAVEESAN